MPTPSHRNAFCYFCSFLFLFCVLHVFPFSVWFTNCPNKSVVTGKELDIFLPQGCTRFFSKTWTVVATLSNLKCASANTFTCMVVLEFQCFTHVTKVPDSRSVRTDRLLIGVVQSENVGGPVLHWIFFYCEIYNIKYVQYNAKSLVAALFWSEINKTSLLCIYPLLRMQTILYDLFPNVSLSIVWLNILTR